MSGGYDGQHIQGTVDEAGVLHLRFNRPPVNAANDAFFFEIGQMFQTAKVHCPPVTPASAYPT